MAFVHTNTAIATLATLSTTPGAQSTPGVAEP
jgi:hypothetical protein